MKVGVIILVVLVILAVVIGGAYVSARNHMVTLNEQVKSDWAQVDVVLQRRSDLIPNLVATVQGFAAHETTVFDDVAKARTQYLNAQTPADKIAASNQLRGAEIKVLALAENYPQLKSNENFLRLQDELAGTENRIAVERQRYNKTLEDYNVYVRQFPNSIWANMAGFHYRDEYFKGNPENSVAPKVDFSK